jgi:hypothetical protein
MGTPLMGGQKMLPNGGSVDSDRAVCGYSVLQAEDMADAKSLMQGHPHLMWLDSCEIEVHEVQPLPGM